MSEKALIWRILELESRAGRLEGIFTADPELGRMWRAQAALTEACRSVALEDIHVFEGDVIYRHLENRMTDSEGARGAAAVGGLLRFIVAPGNLIEDPEHCLTRAWDMAVTIDRDGPGFDQVNTAARIARVLADAPTPFLGALKASIIHRLMTESRVPSADRLIFMAAEHSLRGGAKEYDLSQDHPEALLRRLNASWLFNPSISLTQGAFRAWSPGSDRGHLDLMVGISAELNRTLGAVPMNRRWREEARSFAAGKHGKSKLRDLVDLSVREPILTSPYVRHILGISERASLYIMKEAEEAGILKLITPRQSYRVWATPMMAQTLKLRASRIGGAMIREASQVEDPIEDDHEELPHEPSRAGGLADMDFEERTEAVLAELDEAMAKADAVLAKYRKPQGL